MTTLPLADARAHLSTLIDDAARTHERFEITRDGHPVAVLLGADDYEAMRETIEVLSDSELLREHLQGVAELAASDFVDADHLAEPHRVGKTARTPACARVDGPTRRLSRDVPDPRPENHGRGHIDKTPAGRLPPVAHVVAARGLTGHVGQAE
jgi:antitoxin YefM